MLNDLVIASDTASLSFRSDGKLIGLIDVKILFFLVLWLLEMFERGEKRGAETMDRFSSSAYLSIIIFLRR